MDEATFGISPDSAGAQSAVRTIGASPNGRMLMEPIVARQTSGDKITLFARQPNGKFSTFQAVVFRKRIKSLAWQTFNNEDMSQVSFKHRLTEKAVLELFAGKDFSV